jgi:hypothetical protein
MAQASSPAHSGRFTGAGVIDRRCTHSKMVRATTLS